MIIGEVTDHRSREGGAMIYPVYSRRSGGLSLGINLFPDRKICSFNCPYCEVFPFETDIVFNPETMKTALRSAVLEAKEKSIPVKDLCFSGNGEPTMSPFFMEALSEVSLIQKELIPDSKLVLITNGTGLLNQAMFDFLKSSSLYPVDLNIWLKLDAATETWYNSMSRSEIRHEALLSRIRDFAALQLPFTVQTMLCRIQGALPPQEEGSAWVSLVTELALLSASDYADSSGKSRLRAVQLYGKVRLAPEDPLAEAAPLCVLEERAVQLRAALQEAGIELAVEVYE